MSLGRRVVDSRDQVEPRGVDLGAQPIVILSFIVPDEETTAQRRAGGGKPPAPELDDDAPGSAGPRSGYGESLRINESRLVAFTPSNHAVSRVSVISAV